ncbi:Transmembrane and coiled-coil domain-containing protein C6orf129 [Anas platyrhynchos]|uniref:Coiled-coil domain-containing protein 167 n=1 Tax=Anas platyrhynchos TaxID=8839 RepID=R0K350_ANAPL|nr:Transmembrane and coiled-coil domain-containing protein C6orf129 [Anas platyrhynchos]
MPLSPALLCAVPWDCSADWLSSLLQSDVLSFISSLLCPILHVITPACLPEQIDGLEEKLALCRQSMEEVDLKLRREKLSPEGRKSLERERNLLMTKADNYEKELSVLRKENRKNAALAVAMALLIALIYACWTM